MPFFALCATQFEIDGLDTFLELEHSRMRLSIGADHSIDIEVAVIRLISVVSSVLVPNPPMQSVVFILAHVDLPQTLIAPVPDESTLQAFVLPRFDRFPVVGEAAGRVAHGMGVFWRYSINIHHSKQTQTVSNAAMITELPNPHHTHT